VEAAPAGIVGRLEEDPDVKVVVVFDSALPDFFMAHLNLGRFGEFGDGMPDALLEEFAPPRLALPGAAVGPETDEDLVPML
jgi:enoyl-CoA hydratase/carnithine racemase